MSEYQYYEFHSLDRPLTESEQAVIRKLSSRVVLTPTSAAFTYNYGDFRGNPEEVLLQYFDIMLYMANWGSRRLLFRLPSTLVDPSQLAAYAVEEMISVKTVGDYTLVNLELHDEKGGGWVVGEGWLPSLVLLREDLLQQDYRALYLAWLKAAPLDGVADYVTEPPVPPGLNQLSPALQTFIEFFELDEILVQAAALASPPLAEISEDRLRQAIDQLLPAERESWLLRLAQGEPHLPLLFKRRLQALGAVLSSVQSQQRTVGQLFETADELRAEINRRRTEEAKARHLAELKALAPREDQTWQEVENLIQRSQAKAYGEAVQLLLKLRDLAHYQQKELLFQQRINALHHKYATRSSLLKLLRQAGLDSL